MNSNSPKAVPVERGCGSRVRGGLYIESGLCSDGLPVEAFLIDPPILVDHQRLGITPVGTKLIERNGAWHVVDWIGSRDYPNVADWVEEVSRFGLSRRIAKNTDFSRLTNDSRILLVHSRAYVENFDTYARDWVYRTAGDANRPCPRCPKAIAAHDQVAPPAMCVGVFWQDVEHGEPVAGAESPRAVRRTMPSFDYEAVARPAAANPKYAPAIFASFPITRLVAIRDNDAADKKNAKLLSASPIEHAIEEE